ncbi:MAG: hypothetical protein KDA16_03110, partial [Phycisphaerales bacterium]|nr:hypothetical protein [Phycisphaerales bacterium]
MFSVVRRMSFLGFAAAGLVALAGCRHDHFGHGHDEDPVLSNTDLPQEKSAPAQAPAPAPAMMSGNVASMYFPTGDRATSALLLEQVMPREVRMGESYDYEIRVTNITRGVLQNVVV